MGDDATAGAGDGRGLLTCSLLTAGHLHCDAGHCVFPSMSGIAHMATHHASVASETVLTQPCVAAFAAALGRTPLPKPWAARLSPQRQMAAGQSPRAHVLAHHSCGMLGTRDAHGLSIFAAAVFVASVLRS